MSSPKQEPSPVPSPTPRISLKGQKIPCDQVIEAADKALDAKENEVNKTKEALNESIKNTQTVEEQLQKEKQEVNAWYRDPFVMAPAGIALALGIAVNPLILIAVPVLIISKLFVK